MPTWRASSTVWRPVTRAYSEIWLDGELATSTEATTPDPLYGERYLPRKFKTALAIEGDNCVDIYANDLGLVAHPAADGTLDGFDVLVGGGLGPYREQAEHVACRRATARVHRGASRR